MGQGSEGCQPPMPVRPKFGSLLKWPWVVGSVPVFQPELPLPTWPLSLTSIVGLSVPFSLPGPRPPQFTSSAKPEPSFLPPPEASPDP